MSQPRYNEALQAFVRQWKPNKPELDARFVEDVKALLAAILRPPADAFEVETILTQKGGMVVVRVADYEVQVEPVAAHHLALSLMEAASSARMESWWFRFMREEMKLEEGVMAGMIGHFRNYRIEQLKQELDGDLAKQTVLPKDAK